MNPTLSYLLGRKMWLVPAVVAWGELANFEPELIITENYGAGRRLLHGRFCLGGKTQTITFSDLVDHRGNKLPATLNNASILPIARGNIGAVVQGSATPESFRLARTVSTSQVVVVDLLIIELG